MRLRTLWLVSVALVPSAAHALTIGGGGGTRTDCLSVFMADANNPSGKPRHIRCTDGAPCDADGVVNGQCEFPVAVCANSTFDPGCTLNGVQSITVEHALDNGDLLFDPEFQALQSRIDGEIEPPTAVPDACASATNFHVVLPGPFAGNVCLRGKKLIRLEAQTTSILGQFFTDRDKMRLQCDPAPGGCDPQVLFTSTFDRIQQQVFTRSCAVSGCHDSQTQQAGLLLEIGAAYGDLVGATPANVAASNAGWQRVTAGDPEASFLFHKVTGDLTPAMGHRMPDGQPKLDALLIDIIELWIAAGAPSSGWVPGTF